MKGVSRARAACPALKAGGGRSDAVPFLHIGAHRLRMRGAGADRSPCPIAGKIARSSSESDDNVRKPPILGDRERFFESQPRLAIARIPITQF